MDINATATVNVTADIARPGDMRDGVVIARMVSDRKNVALIYANGGRDYMSISQARLTTITRPVTAA